MAVLDTMEAEPTIMTLDDFRASLAARTPPRGLSKELQALWHEANGGWDSAYKIVQSQKGKAAAAVHAYLHRREGNLSNADYWYERAGSERLRGPLEKEWQALVTELLGEEKQ